MPGRPVLSPGDLRLLPPGDREPAVRIAAGRILAALDAIEGAPCQPGAEAAHARRIAVRQAKLLRLSALAKHFHLTLPPAVAERTASHRKAQR